MQIELARESEQIHQARLLSEEAHTNGCSGDNAQVTATVRPFPRNCHVGDYYKACISACKTGLSYNAGKTATQNNITKL